MGEYDYVAIGEMPSDEVAMRFLLSLGALGNVRTTTLRAFTKGRVCGGSGETALAFLAMAANVSLEVWGSSEASAPPGGQRGSIQSPRSA